VAEIIVAQLIIKSNRQLPGCFFEKIFIVAIFLQMKKLEVNYAAFSFFLKSSIVANNRNFA